jgi:cytochrome bd ubiquinol oxidase subunit II
MLIGVVLRGSAFTFRGYDNTELGKQRWNRVFSVPSVVTPVLLGCVIGAIATGEAGRAAARGGPVPLFSTWIRLFPMVVGLFTLNIFAYLAAVYLTLETPDPDLQNDFRIRALITAVVLGGLAWLVYHLARTEAPLLFQGLSGSYWGRPVRYAAGAFAITALAGLWFRWYPSARAAAMVQVALILWGCALAEYPFLVPPDIDIARSAAPPLVQKLLLAALGAGSAVLLPSMYYLFRVFKGHTFLLAKSTADRGGAADRCR